jgi:hypothetical protein
MRAKVDRNHAEIVQALRSIGASVHSTAMVHNGFPDIAVGFKGVNYLFEIKDDKGKLTPDEKRFADTWSGRAMVVRSKEEALKILGVE